MKKLKICITGANGFVGTNLTRTAVDNGYQVTCLVRESSDISAIEELPVKVVRVNYNSDSSLKKALVDADYLFHLAAKVRAANKKEFYQVNYGLTKRLLQAAEKANVKKFIFLSSQATAGPTRNFHLKTEEEKSVPLTVYGKSKLEAEQYIINNAEIPYSIIRSASVFGPFDTDFLTVFKMIKTGFTFNLGFKEKYISLIYIQDLVKILILALETKKANNEIFFACDGETYSRKYFLDEIATAMNKNPVKIPLPLPVVFSTALLNEVKQHFSDKPYILNLEKFKEMKERFWLCNNSKSQKLLGFQPKYNLSEALAETYLWYKENKWL